MKKQDEILLMTELIKRTEQEIKREPNYLKREGVYVRDLVKELGINENRAGKILEKYEGIYYDYGVNILAGWLIEDKINELKEKIKL
ncbi:MAG: hypothetical protein AABY22_02185 [Nanoarchaeota archaeon]